MALITALLPSLTIALMQDADAAMWLTDTFSPHTAWVIQNPTGPSDYLNVAHQVEGGLSNSENVVDGMPITSMAINIADFGSGRTFPLVGLFLSNLALDASGLTPDLGSPLASLVSPANPVPPPFSWVPFDLPEASLPPGTPRVHAVARLPPGDPGLLGIGGHDGGYGNNSGYSTDAYATPAHIYGNVDLGLNVAQDNSTTTSCKPGDRRPHGRLRVSGGVDLGPPPSSMGDLLHGWAFAGHFIDVAFFGTQPGDQLRFYVMSPSCGPLAPFGPVLSTRADADGDGSYLRIKTAWPCVSGTFFLSAAWGNPACPTPGVGFTNCVTISAATIEGIGSCDDGTIESGWVVQVPSGSSDYFNNNFGDGRCQNAVTSLTLSVLDFGTATPAFPRAGVSNANLAVDPSGNTPDLTHPLALVAPFTFPAGTFATTSAQYIAHAVAIPGSSLGIDVHGWVQFPPGDPGLLGIGADTSSGTNGCSFFSLDGYSSPAVSFFPNWGIRLTVY